MTRVEAIRMLLTIVEECEKHGDRNGGGCRECPFGYGVHCLAYFKDINPAYNDSTRFDTLKRMLDELEQEPCDDVCEWFEQYVDIATDIVELRFSDGTVKKAKRGLYMRDIEKSIRKMLIDQIANEKKQEPKWIPVSERLPENFGEYICTMSNDNVQECGFVPSGENGLISGWSTCEADGFKKLDYQDVIAWMPMPKPYKEMQ